MGKVITHPNSEKEIQRLEKEIQKNLQEGKDLKLAEKTYIAIAKKIKQ